MIGRMIFIFILEEQIWVNQAQKNNTNIPKSGCNIKTTETKEKNIIFKNIEKSFFNLYLPNKTALITIKDGFNNSDG